MKKYITLLFILFALNLSATVYYVAPSGGSDSNAGTNIAAPWATWQHAFYTATAGDRVYFRGGVWYSSAPIIIDPRYSQGHNGTALNPVEFFNYPGEVPILDCKNHTANPNYAIYEKFVSYHHYKGLTVRNVWQTADRAIVEAWQFMYDGTGNITENCTAYQISGTAFLAVNYTNANTFTYINCDAYNCCDTTSNNTPGQYGTGFQFSNEDNDGAVFSYYGCRAWECSDQGFAGRARGYVKLDHCWAMDNNGYGQGDGHGFKPSAPDSYQASPAIQRELVNCISAHNAFSGYDDNSNERLTSRMVWYNNFSYHNGYEGKTDMDAGSGYRLLASTNDGVIRILKNNLSYADEHYQVWIEGNYTHDHNSWDAGVTVTAADFVSLDYTQLYGDRQADGSLPIITFGKLVSTSDLVDAGTTTGIPTYSYEGAAPDIGYDEYAEPVEPIDPIVIYTNSVTSGTTTATTGGNVVDDGGGTVSARGVAYGATVDPTIVGTHTHDGTGTGTFITNLSGLTANTTYHVRAYATNEAGTAYGADVEFTTTAETGLSGDFVFSGGKPVFVKVGGVWYQVIK